MANYSEVRTARNNICNPRTLSTPRTLSILRRYGRCVSTPCHVHTCRTDYTISQRSSFTSGTNTKRTFPSVRTKSYCGNTRWTKRRFFGSTQQSERAKSDENSHPTMNETKHDLCTPLRERRATIARRHRTRQRHLSRRRTLAEIRRRRHERNRDRSRIASKTKTESPFSSEIREEQDRSVIASKTKTESPFSSERLEEQDRSIIVARSKTKSCILTQSHEEQQDRSRFVGRSKTKSCISTQSHEERDQYRSRIATRSDSEIKLSENRRLHSEIARNMAKVCPLEDARIMRLRRQEILKSLESNESLATRRVRQKLKEMKQRRLKIKKVEERRQRRLKTTQNKLNLTKQAASHALSYNDDDPVTFDEHRNKMSVCRVTASASGQNKCTANSIVNRHNGSGTDNQLNTLRQWWSHSRSSKVDDKPDVNLKKSMAKNRNYLRFSYEGRGERQTSSFQQNKSEEDLVVARHRERAVQTSEHGSENRFLAAIISKLGFDRIIERDDTSVEIIIRRKAKRDRKDLREAPCSRELENWKPETSVQRHQNKSTEMSSVSRSSTVVLHCAGTYCKERAQSVQCPKCKRVSEVRTDIRDRFQTPVTGTRLYHTLSGSYITFVREQTPQQVSLLSLNESGFSPNSNCLPEREVHSVHYFNNHCRPLPENEVPSMQNCRPLPEREVPSMHYCRPSPEREVPSMQNCRPLPENEVPSMYYCGLLPEKEVPSMQNCRPLPEREVQSVHYFNNHCGPLPEREVQFGPFSSITQSLRDMNFLPLYRVGAKIKSTLKNVGSMGSKAYSYLSSLNVNQAKQKERQDTVTDMNAEIETEDVARECRLSNTKHLK